ncbi:MAG: phage major capsid protein [Oscillospiraceae bacterium]|jgi:HK97 family phage major capsid protein|nr:phage major capsid protein [Oscillospiraceae bacterium]
MSTLYQKKEDMAVLRAEIAAVGDELSGKAANPAVKSEELDALKCRLTDLDKRFSILKEAHDRQESEEKSAISAKIAKPDGKAAKLQARGEFYKAALLGDCEGIRKAYLGLGGIPAGDADLGYGDRLLPSTLGKEIVSEPFEQNPLREHITVSSIGGLELPRIAYTIDDDFITDKDEAKLVNISAGNTIVFGRNKLKVTTRISDSLLRGSALGLQGYIDGLLRSGLAAKEKKVIFAETPASAPQDETHMSVYNVEIPIVSGSDAVSGILAAIGDLPDYAQANAKVVMRRADWTASLIALANGSEALWGAKPEDIIGVPVIFCEAAIKPIVGDLRQIHLNYDIGTTYDVAKDVDTGIYKFVLTAWFDIQVKLLNALRIVEISAGEGGSSGESN